MNLEQLRGAFGRNKAVLGVAGAAVVAALAWRSRQAKASPAAAAGSGATGSALASYGAGYQTSAATGYDSTASDVYNAIQPQIENLQRLWEEQQAATPPTPVPAAPAPAAVSWGDPRRDTIAGYYASILGRRSDQIGASEINAWDATGAPLETIRASILTSPEAKGLK